MKSTRLLTLVFMLAVCALGWISTLGGMMSNSAERNDLIAQAEGYREERLYQLSIGAYQGALELGRSKQIYEGLMDVSEKYYAEEKSGAAFEAVVNAYDAATKAYPKEVSYWERYTALYLEDKDYSKAASVMKKAQIANASSETLAVQRQMILGAYELGYRDYGIVSPVAVQGSYVFSNNENWGVMDTLESPMIDGYAYISPVGENGMVLARSQESEIFILDGNYVPQARFRADIKQAKGAGCGLIPVQFEGRDDWCYLNLQGEEVFGGFRTAGMFQNGKAAVQMSDGTWCLVDTEGAKIAESTCEEIRLNESGAYVTNGISMYKKAGQWMLYNEKGDVIGSFSADEIDVCLDGAVAFEKDGKWGYVKQNGEVMMEPSYEMARSFSGGSAAVCVNGLWGVIDEQGAMLVEPEFADIQYFDADGSCCPVQVDGEEVYCMLYWKVER